MLDIGWPELMVIAVVALVIIGPKDLPKAVYGVGKWVRKARMVAREFQGHLDDMMREAELDDIKKQALKARDFSVTRELEKAVDPDGKMKAAFDLPPVEGVTAAKAADAGSATAAPADAGVLAAQPQTATEPPVTLPPAAEPPVTKPSLTEPSLTEPLPTERPVAAAPASTSAAPDKTA
ncbi:Sec-independent protein translocase protein TatB [Azospirillum halopraeferens]|uniref:Sec-independent protein translocase protein TatB n=1 Tax=Azospirillum halopraeferens TaxID=34010 RepID=UPI000491465A|nr:Sec-independent protein translocase protein TatB [Azospirillum halopraeferens]